MRLCPWSLLGIVFSLLNNKQTAQANGHLATMMSFAAETIEAAGHQQGKHQAPSPWKLAAHSFHVWGEDHSLRKLLSRTSKACILGSTETVFNYAGSDNVLGEIKK